MDVRTTNVLLRPPSLYVGGLRWTSRNVLSGTRGVPHRVSLCLVMRHELSRSDRMRVTMRVTGLVPRSRCAPGTSRRGATGHRTPLFGPGGSLSRRASSITRCPPASKVKVLGWTAPSWTCGGGVNGGVDYHRSCEPRRRWARRSPGDSEAHVAVSVKRNVRPVVTEPLVSDEARVWVATRASICRAWPRRATSSAGSSPTRVPQQESTSLAFIPP